MKTAWTDDLDYTEQVIKLPVIVVYIYVLRLGGLRNVGIFLLLPERLITLELGGYLFFPAFPMENERISIDRYECSYIWQRYRGAEGELKYGPPTAVGWVERCEAVD
ncbi:uncharacterized protein BO66DRAFT_389947, partial [Aspergillus aculeatinus CBS 121060]